MKVGSTSVGVTFPNAQRAARGLLRGIQVAQSQGEPPLSEFQEEVVEIDPRNVSLQTADRFSDLGVTGRPLSDKIKL